MHRCLSPNKQYMSQLPQTIQYSRYTRPKQQLSGARVRTSVHVMIKDHGFHLSNTNSDVVSDNPANTFLSMDDNLRPSLRKPVKPCTHSHHNPDSEPPTECFCLLLLVIAQTLSATYPKLHTLWEQLQHSNSLLLTSNPLPPPYPKHLIQTAFTHPIHPSHITASRFRN